MEKQLPLPIPIKLTEEEVNDLGITKSKTQELLKSFYSSYQTLEEFQNQQSFVLCEEACPTCGKSIKKNKLGAMCIDIYCDWYEKYKEKEN